MRPCLATVHCLRAALSRAQSQARRCRDERDLGHLPEHALRDLGIGRSEIPASLRWGRDVDGRGQDCGT